jgi:hypothetical protein
VAQRRQTVEAGHRAVAVEHRAVAVEPCVADRHPLEAVVALPSDLHRGVVCRQATHPVVSVQQSSWAHL